MLAEAEEARIPILVMAILLPLRLQEIRVRMVVLDELDELAVHLQVVPELVHDFRAMVEMDHLAEG